MRAMTSLATAAEQILRLTAVGPILGSCLFDVSNMFIKQSVLLVHAVAHEGGSISVLLWFCSQIVPLCWRVSSAIVSICHVVSTPRHGRVVQVGHLFR